MVNKIILNTLNIRNINVYALLVVSSFSHDFLKVFTIKIMQYTYVGVWIKSACNLPFTFKFSSAMAHYGHTYKTQANVFICILTKRVRIDWMVCT